MERTTATTAARRRRPSERGGTGKEEKKEKRKRGKEECSVWRVSGYGVKVVSCFLMFQCVKVFIVQSISLSSVCELTAMLSQQSVFFFFLSSSSYPFNLSMAFTPWMISSSLKEEDEGEGEGEGEWTLHVSVQL